MNPAQNILAATLAVSALGYAGYAWQRNAPADGTQGASARGAAAETAPRRPALVADPDGTSARSRMPQRALPEAPKVAVAFHRGLLTVNASNARLSEVLEAITRVVGVTFAWGSPGDDRVTVDLGPLPTQEVMAGLLERTSYGYAVVGASRGSQGAAPVRVFLLKQTRTVQAAAPVTAGPVGETAAASLLPKPVEMAPPPDEAAMQEQRATDALFDACKAQGCDTS
jgi:hypothetical protein